MNLYANNTLNLNESSSFFETNELNCDLNFLNRNIINSIGVNLENSTNEYISKDNGGKKTYLNIDTKSVVETEVPTSTLQLNADRELETFGKKNEGGIVKVFKCSVCRKEYDNRDKMVRHLRTHTNTPSFSCRDCGKSFRKYSTLIQHQVIHSPNRPFICKLCEKSFNRSSTLIAHRKTHLPEKPFHCHICQKGFHQKGNLKNHIFIHTNLRPYSCEYCDRGFNQMSNLVCHKRKLHPNEMATKWKCNKCTTTFPTRKLVRAHELEHHQVTSDSNKKGKYLQRAIVNDQGILVIPAIQTNAMRICKMNNDIPFGVLQLHEKTPILVRIVDNKNQSILRPLNPTDCILTNENRVSVVASIHQTYNGEGKPIFTVSPPQKMYQLDNGKQKLIDIKIERLIEQRNHDVQKVNINLNGEMVRSNMQVETGLNSKIKRDVFLGSTSKHFIENNYSVPLVSSTLNEEEFNALITAIKTEGYDPDATQIKNIFSENGILM